MTRGACGALRSNGGVGHYAVMVGACRRCDDSVMGGRSKCGALRSKGGGVHYAVMGGVGVMGVAVMGGA